MAVDDDNKKKKKRKKISFGWLGRCVHDGSARAIRGRSSFIRLTGLVKFVYRPIVFSRG